MNVRRKLSRFLSLSFTMLNFFQIELFYFNSTLIFGISPALVFQLLVYFKVDRLLKGLTAQQKGTSGRWYLNRTSLVKIEWVSVRWKSRLKSHKRNTKWRRWCLSHSDIRINPTRMYIVRWHKFLSFSKKGSETIMWQLNRFGSSKLKYLLDSIYSSNKRHITIDYSLLSQFLEGLLPLIANSCVFCSRIINWI